MAVKKNRDLRIYAMIIIAIAVLLYGWLSDDAYHAFVMAKNLADGKGFVYNAGYRVNVSTCPFYTLLTTFFYFIMNRNMYLAGILQGFLFSLAAIYILLYKINKSGKNLLFLLFCIIGCYEFMCYTTSGLENPLLFLLGALFLRVFFDQSVWDTKRLLILFGIHSLILVTRMDNALLYIVVIVYVFFFQCSIPLIKRCLIAITGSVPFIIWELFSIWYYGFPFPNTMYIKLFTDIPKVEYFTKGFDYLGRSYLCDGFMFSVIVAYILITMIMAKRSRHFCIVVGIIIYHLYIVVIGGDFMLGRFLTVPYFLSLCGLSDIYTDSEYAYKLDNLIKVKNSAVGLFAVICLVGSLWRICVSPVALIKLYDTHWDARRTSVADERNVYAPVTGVINRIMDRNDSFQTSVENCYNNQVSPIKKAIEDKQYGYIVEEWIGGIVKYYFVDKGEDIALEDPYGLMDPLLARLPARRKTVWRIGHMVRDIPPGYRKSLVTGGNMINDPDLKDYYDKILEITSGDLFSLERVKTIIDFNMEEYENLKRNYIQSINISP